MRRHLGVGEAERRARLLRRLRGERLDPAEHEALAIARREWKRVGGRLGRAGERLDVDHLGAEVLESGAGFEVAVGRIVRYGGLGAAMAHIVAPGLAGVTAPAGRYLLCAYGGAALFRRNISISPGQREKST